MEMIVMTLILGAIFGAFFLISRVIKSGNSEVVHSNAASKALKLFTKDEVSRHNSRTDCWIIIKDKVYDVTPHVEEHPGGDAILAHAGDDSTEGFYGPQHATRVFDMVDEFYIGDDSTEGFYGPQHATRVFDMVDEFYIGDLKR